MAQANNANRQTRKMNAALDGAFQSGSQPSQNKNLAIVVRAPNRKRFTLVTKEGQVTEAGKYWYEQLHQVTAPTIYRYEQPLIDPCCEDQTEHGLLRRKIQRPAGPPCQL